MAGPWEQYATPEATPAAPASDGPWSQYAEAPKKFGLGDTWPARLAKSVYSAATLPGDVMSGQTQVDPSNPEFIGRTLDFATVGTPMAPKAVAGLAAPKAGIPSAEELKTAANQGYDTARNMGVDIKPEAVANSAQILAQNLEKDGINAKLAPKTFGIIDELAAAPPGSVATISNLETARRSLGHAAQDFLNPTEKMAASRAIQHLDDYLGNIPQADVLAGDAAQASKVLSEARANYAASKRSDQITGELEIADRNAAAANSGQNIGNSVRQRFNSILKSDKKTSGFTDEELAQMERAVRGTTLGNATRVGGNLLGGGGGLGAAVTAGIGGAATAHMGGIGALAPVVGYGLKKFSNASVERQVRKLDEMTRSRAPLSQGVPSAALTPLEKFKREAALRAFLASQARNGPN